MVLVGLFLLAGLGILTGIHPFLAPNDPLEGGALVVEGWVDDVVLADAIEQVHRHHYAPVFVTGGSITKGAPFAEFGTMAEMGAATIRLFSNGMIEPQPVPAPDVRKDRTYTSAIALKTWMEEHGGIDSKITILSAGPHSRRTRLLFQKAFGRGIQIGVIAAPAQGYDSKRWWTYSEGFRTVVSEAIAYLYARLIFWQVF